MTWKNILKKEMSWFTILKTLPPQELMRELAKELGGKYEDKSRAKRHGRTVVREVTLKIELPNGFIKLLQKGSSPYYMSALISGKTQLPSKEFYDLGKGAKEYILDYIEGE